MVVTTGTSGRRRVAAEQWADVGVVVDDVAVGQSAVGGLDVQALVHESPIGSTDSVNSHDRFTSQRRLAHGEQLDLVAGERQASRQVVDDGLGASVAGRRYRDPRGGYQSDAHDSSSLEVPAGRACPRRSDGSPALMKGMTACRIPEITLKKLLRHETTHP